MDDPTIPYPNIRSDEERAGFRWMLKFYGLSRCPPVGGF